MIINLNERTPFAQRHHGGSSAKEVAEMLAVVGVDSIDELMDQTVPKNIRPQKKLNLPEALDDVCYLKHIKDLGAKNKVFKSFIGQGYYGCMTPSVIQRNILENPGWYTAYTPYQSEIAQGRLEALINFQSAVSDLTGMEIANASLLDEGTAAAEAMSMQWALRKKDKKQAHQYFVDENLFAQTIDVLKTRARAMDIILVVGDYQQVDMSDSRYFGLVVQYPNAKGSVEDYRAFFAQAKAHQVSISVAADLMSLVRFTPPGEIGADVVVGTTQRFGVPMGFGGPHAAYFATKEAFKRHIPGRIIGVSVDRQGKKAYRMALQTREQHIKRERATSNICTAQVLLAVMAGAYAVYHGPNGLKRIANRIQGLATLADKYLKRLGFEQANTTFFDTLHLPVDEATKTQIRTVAEAAELNFNNFHSGAVGISFDETHKVDDLLNVLAVFEKVSGKPLDHESIRQEAQAVTLPERFKRTSEYLAHPVFHQYQSEHEMLRYLKRLENKDLSLTHAMISLGSCTMKLNATTEMLPITWPEFAAMHPFAPPEQTEGYQTLIRRLAEWLSEITGLHTTSLQPNSGAQGEYAGLLVIKAYQADQGETHRNVTLIPSSAHGTNPASAMMAGNQVIVVKCDERGNIDVNDLSEKATTHKDRLSSLMITYPSTHGVFEESVKEVCRIIHENGGQVYMDGANMNAQVGITSPGFIGADVCHLNLHKTFAIPHGGGGPGVGPISVAQHLAPFLPTNPLTPVGGDQAISSISAAPYGSAGVLPISYGYIALMGAEGLTHATKQAILHANYIQCRLKEHFSILYTGAHGRCAHEMIVDCREFKAHGIEVEDLAKRLIDYGFHAPTVSFPVAGTLMIEPTESESKEELDRFCDAMLEIRKSIAHIASGKLDQEDNMLKNAPHTAEVVMSEDWNHAYSRATAAYPLAYLRTNKFWPSVSRVDNVYGDRNLFCSCIPVLEEGNETF